jgi:putative tryptophan/tyrosine transport system substrate-binding protein
MDLAAERTSFRKRVLAASLGALVALLLAATGCSGNESAAAQPVKRVGLMHVGTDHVPPSLGTLAAELQEKYGWDVPVAAVDKCQKEIRKSCDFKGKDIELLWRNLTPEEAPAQAEKFVREHVDVIVAFEDQSIRAAQDATAKPGDRIPIVFLHPSDPVRQGLVKSLARPGGNLTGVFGPRDVVAKQLELYHLLVPRLHRVLTLVNPDDPASGKLLAQYDLAASQLRPRVKLEVRNASSARDLARIFHSLQPGEVDGAFLLSPTLRLNYSGVTINFAQRAHIPVQAHRKEWVENGALFSYGADLGPIGRAGARYVDSLLRATPAAKLPVEEIPTIDFAINLKTANRLGIRVPEDMIIRANEVYR